MMTLNDSLRIKVEPTVTTFQSYIDGHWVTSGEERNALFNGTKSVIRNASVYDITYTINQSTNYTEIKRISTYKTQSTPTITDIYKFDGGTDAVELFPVSHTIIIQNGSGLIYQYEVSKLEYTGETIKDVTSPQSFGKNMIVEWGEGNYYSKIFKYTGSDTGKLTIKYRVDSDYEEYSLRLFDPVLPNLTIINPTSMGGNFTYDQVYITSLGSLTVNSTGYLNITANNITILGPVSANGVGYTPGATSNSCGGGAIQGTTGNGPGNGSGGTGYACTYCGSCSTATGGSGATKTYASNYDTSVYFGSSGGSGGFGNAKYCSSTCPSEKKWNAAGGSGGGWIYLNASYITVSSTISANGANGANGPCNTYYCKSGGGGGGSAGDIVIVGDHINLNGATINTVGGSGGSGTSTGGTGSGGNAKVFYYDDYTASSLTVNSGVNGAYTVSLSGLDISPVAPANGTYTNASKINISCSYLSNDNPFYNYGYSVYNSGNEIASEIYNTSLETDKQYFTHTFYDIFLNESGILNWKCSAYSKPLDLYSNSCYQEQANKSYQCGAIATGSYSKVKDSSNGTLYDGDLTTGLQGWGIDPAFGVNITTTYKKPANLNVSVSTYIVAKDMSCYMPIPMEDEYITYNYVTTKKQILPTSCMSYSGTDVKIRYENYSVYNSDFGFNEQYIRFTCYNGTKWVNLTDLTYIYTIEPSCGPSFLAEEGIEWGINYGLVDYNYSYDVLKSTESIPRTFYLDNYSISSEFIGRIENNSWYNMNNISEELDVSGVDTYSINYTLRESGDIVNNTIVNDSGSIAFYNLSDGNYSLSANITSCPLCGHTPVMNPIYQNGLVSYYKLDETSGTTAVDSKNYVNAINTNAQVNQDGKIGKSYFFNNNAYLTRATTGIGTTGSTSFWLYPTSINVLDGYFDTYPNNAGATRIYISGTNAAQICIELGADTSSCFNHGMTINNWYFITLNWNTTTREIYINGTLIGVDTGITPVINSIKYGLMNGEYASSRIDEISLYNRTLTSAEILTIYNSGGGIPFGTGNSITYSTSNLINFLIDTVSPIINWTPDTTALTRTADFGVMDWIYGNVQLDELNLKNITFTLRTSSGTINQTTYEA